jgi:ribosomal RNA-processing protein 12
MAKYRSKLKRKSGAKQWARNQSSTSNPTTNKHRAKATSRFFQANLNSGKFFRNNVDFFKMIE